MCFIPHELRGCANMNGLLNLPDFAKSQEYAWTLRRQNFLPKGPGGRNVRRKAPKTPPARKNAETQQTLRHAETCFRRFPAEFRRFPAACFAQNLILKNTLPGKLKRRQQQKGAFFQKSETSADLGGPGMTYPQLG